MKSLLLIIAAFISLECFCQVIVLEPITPIADEKLRIALKKVYKGEADAQKLAVCDSVRLVLQERISGMTGVITKYDSLLKRYEVIVTQAELRRVEAIREGERAVRAEKRKRVLTAIVGAVAVAAVLWLGS